MEQGKKWVAGGLMIVLLMAAIPLFAAALPISGATASSELSPLTAAKAIDGNRGTFYSSQGHPDADHTEWLQLDLGSRQHAISGVRLDARVKGYGFRGPMRRVGRALAKSIDSCKIYGIV